MRGVPLPQIISPFDRNAYVSRCGLHGYGKALVRWHLPPHCTDPYSEVYGMTCQVPGLHRPAGPGLEQLALALDGTHALDHHEVHWRDLDSPLHHGDQIRVNPL